MSVAIVRVCVVNSDLSVSNYQHEVSAWGDRLSIGGEILMELAERALDKNENSMNAITWSSYPDNVDALGVFYKHESGEVYHACRECAIVSTARTFRAGVKLFDNDPEFGRLIIDMMLDKYPSNHDHSETVH